MKDTFDLHRFGLYARKEFRENGKTYALFPLFIIGLQLFLIYWECSPLRDSSYYNQLKRYRLDPYSSLYISSVIVPWIVGDFMLRSFSGRQKTLNTLTLPVSVLERFCFAWLITVPISLLLVYGLWKLNWFVGMSVIKETFPKAYVEYRTSHFGKFQPYDAVFVFGLSAAFMLGSVVLGRFSLLKTLSIIIGIGAVSYCVKSYSLHFFIPDTKNMVFAPTPFLGEFLNMETVSGLRLWPRSTMRIPHFIWWIYCLPVVLWGVTLLKIKEKQA